MLLSLPYHRWAIGAQPIISFGHALAPCEVVPAAVPPLMARVEAVLLCDLWGSRWMMATPIVSVQCVTCQWEIFVACRAYDVRTVVLQRNRRGLGFLDAPRFDILLQGR